MLRASAVTSSNHVDRSRVVDRVVLDADERHRRRIVLTTERSTELLLDLPQATALRDGDGLVLEDGTIVLVVGKPEALLEIADSSMTYRRRYLSGVQVAPVLDLLLADETNPRSVVFQFLALRDVVSQLPRNQFQAGQTQEQRVVLALLAAVQLADIHGLAAVDGTGHRPHLAELLIKLEKELPGLSDVIAHRYLSHLDLSRQLAQGG